MQSTERGDLHRPEQGVASHASSVPSGASLDHHLTLAHSWGTWAAR